jgi:hypothetical protein
MYCLCMSATVWVQPHGVIRVFNTIFYENKFQNPKILMDTLEIT